MESRSPALHQFQSGRAQLAQAGAQGVGVFAGALVRVRQLNAAQGRGLHGGLELAERLGRRDQDQMSEGMAVGRMDTGTVWINKHAELAPNIPFGGAKLSGVGTELGEEGLSEFTQLHVINMARV